jgi:hypothetical protein
MFRGRRARAHRDEDTAVIACFRSAREFAAIHHPRRSPIAVSRRLGLGDINQGAHPRTLSSDYEHAEVTRSPQ